MFPSHFKSADSHRDALSLRQSTQTQTSINIPEFIAQCSMHAWEFNAFLSLPNGIRSFDALKMCLHFVWILIPRWIMCLPCASKWDRNTGSSALLFLKIVGCNYTVVPQQPLSQMVLDFHVGRFDENVRSHRCHLRAHHDKCRNCYCTLTSP